MKNDESHIIPLSKQAELNSLVEIPVRAGFGIPTDEIPARVGFGIPTDEIPARVGFGIPTDEIPARVGFGVALEFVG
jgi:hypothetical protein